MFFFFFKEFFDIIMTANNFVNNIIAPNLKSDNETRLASAYSKTSQLTQVSHDDTNSTLVINEDLVLNGVININGLIKQHQYININEESGEEVELITLQGILNNFKTELLQILYSQAMIVRFKY